MSRNFRFTDHTADIAVKLEGSSLEELFTAGFEAWSSSVAEKEELKSSEHKKFDISANSTEELLVSFLNELNFLLITKRWLCLKVDSIKISKHGEEFRSSADLNVIKVKDDFELKEEIKSVTYHQIAIVKKDDMFTTLLVFDI